jgi:transposase-like protein
MRSVNFSEDNLAVQWQYVKRNLNDLGLGQAAREGFQAKAHRAIEELLQAGINEEFTAGIRARRYEHAKDKRLDTRKGGYFRYLTTAFGRSRVKIPVVRNGNVKIVYSLFEKYQRRQKEFDNAVVLSMLLGLSCRKQARFFKSFIGDSVSHTTASNLLGILQERLNEFRARSIEDKYKYLLIDGMWVSVKEDKIRNRVILIVAGITPDNKKEIIAFKLAQGETEEEGIALLNDLYRRGLKGKNLKVAVSDGAKGIQAAIKFIYPYAKWQLCYTHKLRNLSKNIRHKAKHRKKLMLQARTIYQAKSKQQALKRFYRFYLRWKDIEPYAVKCFKDGFHDTLNFYDVGRDRNFISTSNHLERDIEEIRRRTKIQGYFKSENSLNLWIYGIITQIRDQEQPFDMPDKLFSFPKVPLYKCVQNS